MNQPDSFTTRFCRLCAAFAVAIAVLVIVVLVVVLRPQPEPPPDYAKIPLVSDMPWNTLNADGWYNSQRTGRYPVSITALADAPVSPTNVLAIPFEGTQPDTEPSVIWHALPTTTEVYYEYDFRVSANWQCNPAGCGKLSFIFSSGGGPLGGDSYVGIYCPTAPLGSCERGDESPMRIGGQLQFGDYGGTPIMPNLTTTPIERDRWTHITVYYKWSSTPTTHDGIWRVWVDGVLNIERADIAFAMDPAIEWQIAMTKQLVPDPPAQFAWFDHVLVRSTSGGPLVHRKTPRTPRRES